MSHTWMLLLVLFFLNPVLVQVFAEESINITISSDMNEVIFDGKWTHQTEWKRSSLNSFSYDDNQKVLKLRTAHQDNFVYVLIDFVSDTTPETGKDYAVVCFDTKNDKTISSNNDDYCFFTTLDNGQGIVKQGDESSADYNFREIDHPDGFIGLSTASDSADRYSAIPHSSYEFRIPTDLISRNNVYGFYFGVYDASSNKTYSYPSGTILKDPHEVPNPSLWGELVSPDKSLPEFHLPLIAMFSALVLTIYFSKNIKRKIE